MKTIWSAELYAEAWRYACRAHKDQRLPGTDLPFVTHVGLVAMEVMGAVSRGAPLQDPDLAVQSALLHDVIEWTSTEYGDVLETFGPEVADGVLALTKNKELMEPEEQMADSLARIRLQPKEIWVVKLADRISKFPPPPSGWSPDKIERYCRETAGIHDALHEADPGLAARLHQKMESFRASY